MICVRSSGKPSDDERNHASAPGTTFTPLSDSFFATLLKWRTPLSSVLRKSSSSPLSTAMTCACFLPSSGKKYASCSITTGTSVWKKPGGAPRNVLPYQTARRRMRRSTYPRPMLSGTAPSVMANESVRMWSATTRYAMSFVSASASPTSPVYGGAPVARWIAAKMGMNTSVS